MLLSRSATFRAAIARLRLFAQTDEAVLIQGETGTGKTALAQCVHAWSSRAPHVFESLNMAAIDESLAASELFGHVPGAFTDARGKREGVFATAHGGTLFLDEIGKTSRSVQAKLLGVLESRSFRPLGADRTVTVDARLVFAANEPLDELVAEGRMLPDFVPRLGYFNVVIPPLRERTADIPDLVRSMVVAHAGRLGYRDRPAPVVSKDLAVGLASLSWPHNLRQLDACVRRLLVDARGASQLGISLLEVQQRGALYGQPGGVVASRASTRERDLTRIADAIERSNGNKSAAARHLGMSRSTLYRRRNELSPPDSP